MSKTRSKRVITQTFRLGRYRIYEDAPLDGLCDIPGDENLTISILPGNSLRALHTALHEAAHAEGVLPRHLDVDRDFTEHQARLLWRLGWRRLVPNDGGEGVRNKS